MPRKKQGKPKKYKAFDPDKDYIEDMDCPSRLVSWLMFPFDPMWCYMSVTMIALETFALSILEVRNYKVATRFMYSAGLWMIYFDYIYILECLCTLIVQSMKLDSIVNNLAQRPNLMVVLEMLCSIPYVFMFPQNVRSVIPISLNYIRTGKMIRVMYFLHRMRCNWYIDFRHRLLELAVIVIISLSYIAVLLKCIYCMRHTCTYNMDFSNTMYEIAARRSLSRWEMDHNTFEEFDLSYFTFELFGVAILLYLTFITMKLMSSYMIISSICEYYYKFEYVEKVNFFRNYYSGHIGLSAKTRDTVMKYYENLWIFREGYNSDFMVKVRDHFTSNLIIEICMDYSWSAFQHSLLFRNTDLQVLRLIASVSRKSIHMQGEFLYKKDELKEQMVYISNGVVEILSSENGESGVLALTSGTCVGESSLLFPYISDVDFRCKTTTELFTLHRSDFVVLCRHHPTVYRDFLQNILKRYRDARKLIDVKQCHPNGSRNLLQLKNTLHRLSSKNKELYRMHAPENIYLANELNFECKMYPFNTMRYLELLSIKERHLDTDIVFIKSTGMWILKPNSPVLAAWEYIVLFFCWVIALWIPYMCSMKDRLISTEFIILFNVLWWIDLIILSVTPINSESKATTVVAIISERINQLSFACDIIAVVPSIMLSSLMPHDLIAFNKTWLEMNKVLKVYRIFKFLNDWERQFNVNILLHTAVKYGFLYIMLIYYTSCAMVASGIAKGLFTTIAVQMASGVGYLYADFQYIPYTIVLDYVSYFLEFAATNAILSSFYLRYNKRKKIQSFFARVFHYTHKRTDKKNLLNRLNLCLQTHLNDNDGLMLMVSMPKFLGLSPFFMHMVQTEGFVDILASVEMLNFLPKALIAKLSVICNKVIHHRQCVLISRGVIYDQVFILCKGVAKKVVGKRVYDTERLTMLNLLEICYGLPSSITVICLTEVVCLYFKYSDFERLLIEFPETNELFKRNMKANDGIRDLLMRIGRAKNDSKLMVKDFDNFQVWKFKKGNAATVFENHDYYTPFYKLGLFSFVRFVLMSKTVHPESKFLLYWERFRFSFAILSSVLFLIPFFNSTTSSSSKLLLFMLLDLTAYADVYFRMHVCFYNEIGILVKHPLETARHYLKNGFFVDLIAILPINYFVYDDDISVCFVSSCLRLIQLHRFYSYKASFMWPSLYLQLAVNFISLVIFINFCSSVIVVNDCDNSYKNDTEWVILCKTVNMEYFDIFSYYFYVVSSTVTTVAMDTYISFEHSHFLINFLAYLSAISVVIKIYIVSNVFSSFCSNDVQLPVTRKSTASLLNFMRKRNVSLYLQREIKKYFDTSWMVIGDGNPYELYANLNTSLKRDLLFEFYGYKLTGHSLLSDNKLLLEDFFKNCLIEMEMMTLNKDGYILTINDIQGKIFFLHTGYVDVVAADGTVLDTLGESSIFGNMENISLFRQKVTMVTNTTVLVFSMKTKTFYMLINYFPHIKKTFLHLKRFKQYYIESSAPKMVRKRMNLRLYNKAMVRYRLFRKYSLVHALLPCYVGIMMELYQTAVCEISPNFLAVQYCLDVMHIAYSVLKFFVGYLDDNWELIIDRKLVKKPHMKRTELAITVITCLPLDLLMLMFFDMNNIRERCYWLNGMRINRVLRIYYLFRYYSDHVYKYTLTNGYTVWKRSCVFMLELTMYVAMCATFLIWCERTFWFVTKKKSFSVHYYKVRLWMSRIYRAPSSIKFDIFFKYCYFVAMFLTFKSDRNYYISSTMIMSLYMIVVLASYIFSILMFAQLFEIIVECLSPHVHYGYIINFIMHYLRSSASPIIKLKLSTQMHNSWLNMQSHSLRALTIVPPYLRQAVMYSVYGHLFADHIIFGRAHKDFVRQLLVHAKQVLYLCDDIITYKNVDRECMYFIVSGQVAVLEDETHCLEAAHEILGAGDSFGIIEGLLPKHPFKYTYRTVGNCEILELLLKDWQYLLDFFPATKEHIFDVYTNSNLY